MSATTGRRALVTGAGGFVGANLVRRLLRDGHEVTATLRPGSSDWRLAEVATAVRLHALDLSDDEAVARFVAGARADWVFHLAAHGAYSWQRDVRRIMEVNALGTVSLVDACARSGCGAFVHAGSSSEYGLKDHAPDEREALEPNSAYAVAKAAATLYCRHAARSGRLNAVTLRLYSAYGPWEDPRRLVPTLAVKGMEGELPPLVSPDVARDFVAVEDVVEAMILAAERADAVSGAVLNVGSGRQTTIGELVDVARRVLEIEAEPDWGSEPDRDWDTAVWVADPSRAERELGWRAGTGIEEGFARTVEWLRSTPAMWEEYGIRG